MGETPAFMRKGYIFQKMEEISKNPKMRDAFLAALNDHERDYVTILHDFGLLENSAHENHLRKHWCPPDPYSRDAWWPHCQPIEPILRQGYAKAFEEAQRRGWPIDGYWVSNGDKVAVGIGVNELEQKITLIRITPPCPTYKPDPSIIAVVEFKGPNAPGGVVETTTVIGPQPVQTAWTQTEKERRLA